MSRAPHAEEPTTQRIRAAFAAVLKDLRTQRGLSQESLAAEAGYDRTYVGQIERSEKSITVVTLFQLAKALGTTPVDIVTDAQKRL